MLHCSSLNYQFWHKSPRSHTKFQPSVHQNSNLPLDPGTTVPGWWTSGKPDGLGSFRYSIKRVLPYHIKCMLWNQLATDSAHLWKPPVIKILHICASAKWFDRFQEKGNRITTASPDGFVWRDHQSLAKLEWLTSYSKPSQDSYLSTSR